MPGQPNRRRSASTSAVMTPRFSATKGSLPSSSCMASKTAAPGPFTHRPCSAVGSPTGTSQYASKPRKWSSRTRSKNRRFWRIRSTWKR